MKKIVLIAVFLTLIVGSGVLHGLRTERWTASQDVEGAARRIADMPLEFDDWRGQPIKIEKTDLQKIGIKGHFFGQYKNAHTGDAFNVLLVCGRPGPISVHTPDVCYEGAGYRAIGKEQLRDVSLDDASTQKFMALEFRKPNSANAATLEVLWAWNGGDGWLASENPRALFAHHSVLYKLYVIREVSPRSKDKIDPYPEFLRSFLPRLNAALYPKAAS